MNDPADALKAGLANIGKQEIYLWKEMVLDRPAYFEEIWALISSPDPRLAWHAAWVVDHVSEANPKLLQPYIPELIRQLPELKSSSLKRHFTRMLIGQEIPESLTGKLVDCLFNLLSPREAVAVRANALEILFRISKQYPELQAELAYTLDAILEEELTPGMRSKGKKIRRILAVKVP